MAYPISKNLSTDKTQQSDDQSLQGYDGWDLENSGLVDEGSGDQYFDDGQSTGNDTQPLTASDLRLGISQLEAGLDPKDSQARETLDRLKHQINAAVALSPKNREAQLMNLQNQIGRVQSDLENLSGTGVNGSGGTPTEGSGDTTDIAALEAKKKELGDKIENFHAKGWITDDLYDALSKDLEGVDFSDPDLLDANSTTLTNLEGSIDSIAGLYKENNNEAVDQVDGVKNDITKDKLPPELKKLMDLIPSIQGKPEKLIEKLLSAFPELDANDDGVLSTQELKDGVTHQLFPPQRPNNALIKFMTDLDPELKDKWDATTSDFSNDSPSNDAGGFPRYRSLMTDCNKRLVDLLNAVYGDGKVKMDPACDSNWHAANNLVWTDNSQIFEAFDETKTSRDVNVQWY